MPFFLIVVVWCCLFVLSGIIGNGGGSGNAMSSLLRRRAPGAEVNEQSLVEAAVVDIKRVLDHESAELYRESLSQQDAAVSEPGDTEMREVIDELLRTEAHYLADMRFTVSKFAKPLRELLDAGQTKAIFSNLAQILELHARLLTSLPEPDARPSDSPPRTAAGGGGSYSGHLQGSSGSSSRRRLSVAAKGHTVATAFIRMQPFFKCYSTYCANYPYVSGALLKARSEHRVASFLQGAELAHSISLQALLFRPVQRMCVYPLLFQQALKHAPQSHPQHAVFQEAFVVMQQTVTQVNEQV